MKDRLPTVSTHITISLPQPLGNSITACLTLEEARALFAELRKIVVPPYVFDVPSGSYPADAIGSGS